MVLDAPEKHVKVFLFLLALTLAACSRGESATTRSADAAASSAAVAPPNETPAARLERLQAATDAFPGVTCREIVNMLADKMPTHLIIDFILLGEDGFAPIEFECVGASNPPTTILRAMKDRTP